MRDNYFPNIRNFYKLIAEDCNDYRKYERAIARDQVAYARNLIKNELDVALGYATVRQLFRTELGETYGTVYSSLRNR